MSNVDNNNSVGHVLRHLKIIELAHVFFLNFNYEIKLGLQQSIGNLIIIMDQVHVHRHPLIRYHILPTMTQVKHPSTWKDQYIQ